MMMHKWDMAGMAHISKEAGRMNPKAAVQTTKYTPHTRKLNLETALAR
jgi:hypothetical protein